MSATKVPIIQKFIDYLEKYLCDIKRNCRFEKVGPRCFFYKDEIDMIFVKITDENLIIITDGHNVIDHIEMIFLAGMDSAENREEEEKIFDDLLQNILHKF